MALLPQLHRVRTRDETEHYRESASEAATVPRMVSGELGTVVGAARSVSRNRCTLSRVITIRPSSSVRDTG